jgi:hypothetical protein
MTSAPRGNPRQQAGALDPKCAPLLIPAIMAIAMSFVIPSCRPSPGSGSHPNLASAWLTSFAIGVAVAIPTAILVAPRPAAGRQSHRRAAPLTAGQAPVSSPSCRACVPS